MGIFTKRLKKDAEKPYPQEIEEAKQNPNGWVYRIAGKFSDGNTVPPEAIVGAWQVDSNGIISSEFQRNPKYNPDRWPS